MYLAFKEWTPIFSMGFDNLYYIFRGQTRPLQYL